jgi:hypothetical protein
MAVEVGKETAENKIESVTENERHTVKQHTQNDLQAQARTGGSAGWLVK